MKRALLCAVYFVPRNNIASYRAGCFAKYLPENGWQPTVLCQDWPKGSPEFDPDFVGRFPESVQVIRVPNPKPAGFYERVLVRKVMPYFCAQRVPILWWRQARRSLATLLAQNRFDVAWGTSDPMSPLVLARDGAGQLGCRWVADLRDSFNVQRFGAWYKRPFFALQERRLCRAADIVTTVSSGLAEVVARRTGRSVRVIHNGFDPALFGGHEVAPSPTFRLVYAGKLVWPRQNPTPLFQAIRSCLERGLIPRSDLELCFYGSHLERFSAAHPDGLDGLPLHSYPRTSHREILRVIQASPVLLLFAHAHERGVLTGKLFDYLAANQAILAIPDDHGEVAALLHHTRAGVSLSTPEAIAGQLAAWYQTWKAGARLIPERNEGEIARYSRREQTRALAGIFEELVPR